MSDQFAASLTETLCSQYSRNAGEQLIGTAKPIDLWVLIEFPGKWESDPVAVLPLSLQTHLAELRSAPRTRIALIKKTNQSSETLACFVALSRETNPHLYRFEFHDYEELTAIDFKRLRSESPAPPVTTVEDPFFAVCTHGTHDRCCSRFGYAVFDDLKRLPGVAVWQISHIGGCRFAPNLVCLPHGVMYGRLTGSDCAVIVESYRRGCIHLGALRGRSCYSKPVQAAEFFVRTAHRLTDLRQLTLSSVEDLGGNSWRIGFHSLATGANIRSLSPLSLVSTAPLNRVQPPKFHRGSYSALFNPYSMRPVFAERPEKSYYL